MPILLKCRDFFKADDVVAAGPVAWEKVRELARGLGYNVSKNFGNFDVVAKSVLNSKLEYVVGLDDDGDMMCSHAGTRKFEGGRLRTMAEFAHKRFPHVKIRVDNNKEIFWAAVEELKRRGYDDAEVMKLNADRHGNIVGAIGHPNGKIFASVSEEGFSQANEDADELVYDLKQVLSLYNVRVKPKLVEVSGVMCEVGAFQAFLEAQRKANPQ